MIWNRKYNHFFATYVVRSNQSNWLVLHITFVWFPLDSYFLFSFIFCFIVVVVVLIVEMVLLVVGVVICLSIFWYGQNKVIHCVWYVFQWETFSYNMSFKVHILQKKTITKKWNNNNSAQFTTIINMNSYSLRVYFFHFFPILVVDSVIFSCVSSLEWTSISHVTFDTYIRIPLVS